MNQNIYDKLKQILSSAQVKAEDKGRTFTGYYML